MALSHLHDGLTIVAVRALGHRDEAEDAAQEAILRVLAVLRTKGIPQGYSLESYTYGTLKHVIADAHRRTRRRALVPHWLSSNGASPMDALIDTEQMQMLTGGLASLDPDESLLLERCYVNGEKIVDIARSTGEPAERIRKRKSRALERLRGHVLGSLKD